MSLHSWAASCVTFLILLQSPSPRLVFDATGPEQPRWVEGVPDWRDSVFVRHDTLIVRHLRERRVYTRLKANLWNLGKRLELRVREDAGAPGHEGAVPGGLTEAAYEARIAPLAPGTYRLTLRDDGYRSALKPFISRHTIKVPGN